MRLKLPRPWWRRSRGSGAARQSDCRICGEPAGDRCHGSSPSRGSRTQPQGPGDRDPDHHPVIEALERGWRDRLPERTYSLDAAAVGGATGSADRQSGFSTASTGTVLRLEAGGRGLRRFTPGTIDVLTTWQGSVVYVLVIGLSLMALNRQQQDLALRNSQTLEPVQADLRGLRGLMKTSPSPLIRSCERCGHSSRQRSVARGVVERRWRTSPRRHRCAAASPEAGPSAATVQRRRGSVAVGRESRSDDPAAPGPPRTGDHATTDR